MATAPSAGAAAPPEMPAEAAYLWGWFVEILAGVAPGFGPAMIGWSDVGAWSALTGSAPEPWEARAIVMLSALRARILSEEAERDAARDKNRTAR